MVHWNTYRSSLKRCSAPRTRSIAVFAILGACLGGYMGTSSRSVAQSGATLNVEKSTAAAVTPPASRAPAPSAGATLTASVSTPLAITGNQPALSSELERLRREAQMRVLGLRALAETAPAGQFVPVEHEWALDHFHRALERLAAGLDEDGKVRILAYGASHTQADIYPGYLRSYLQSRFGDGGQGFVLPGRVNRWHQNRSMPAWHHALSVRHSTARRDVKNEPLGLFGAALVGRHAGSYGKLTVPKGSLNTRFEVHYFSEPGGGDFKLEVDGAVVAEISTASVKAGPAFHPFETSPSAHEINVRLKGNGPVRLFGIIAETASPGVVVDTLGISGAHMASNLAWEEETWAAAVRHRNPDLVTFAYGTNESADTSLSVGAYEVQLSSVLTRLRRAAPQASCLLIAPFDVPKRARTRLLKVLEVQRRVSREFGCGFWNGYAFMGGEGSMRRWVMAKPPLASTDHIHLTDLGYVYAGMAIGDALMRAYDLDPVHSSATAALGAASTPFPSAALPPGACEAEACR